MQRHVKWNIRVQCPNKSVVVPVSGCNNWLLNAAVLPVPVNRKHSLQTSHSSLLLFIPSFFPLSPPSVHVRPVSCAVIYCTCLLYPPQALRVPNPSPRLLGYNKILFLSSVILLFLSPVLSLCWQLHMPVLSKQKMCGDCWCLPPSFTTVCV